MPKRCVHSTCFLTFAGMDQQLHRHSRDDIASDSATTFGAARKGRTSGNVASVFCAVRWTLAAVVLLAGVLSGLLFSVAAAAHVPSPPANSGCERAAVVAKLSVVEDRAAANMLAEAILALDLGGRCLVDAGNPATGVSPSRDAREAVAAASSVYVVGGPAAIPDEWIRDQFGVHSPTRVHGCDRWATQEATVRAVLALARGTDVSSSMLCGSGTGELPPNLNCGLGAVIAKLSVTEDRAAANMFAEARKLTSVDGDARCLIDAGDPSRGVPPTQAAKIDVHRAGVAWVVGGAAALPAEWLARQFGDIGATRIGGGDRWATQSAVVQEIVRLGQKSDGRDGDSSGSASGALVEEDSAGSGQFAIDDVTVEVHLCAAAGAFDEGDLAREVKLLNDNVVPWFESQFGNSGASIRFAAGKVLDITAEEWKSENFEFLYSAERDPSSHPCERDSLSRHLPGYTLRSQWKRALIIADVPVLRTGTHGYAYRPTGPAWVAYRERLPDRPYRFQRDKYYFAAVAHELGHSLYGLEHVWKGWSPQPAEDCPSIRRAASGDAVRQHELESLMAWAPCRGIYDLSDGKGAFLLCRQRQELGWTAPGECNSSGITVPAPGVPALTRVVPGDRSLRLEWNAPTGPARVTDYDVIYRPAGTSGWTEWRPEEISTRLSATITGLTNGQRYEVLVWAHNDSAFGPNSRSLFGTPRVPEPDDTTQPEPQRATVTVSAGADARPTGHCSSVHCRWLRIDVQGFGSGPLTVECWHEQFRNFARAAFHRATVSNLPTENVCFFGFPGVKVWAVVDGIKSNELTWPRG